MASITIQAPAKINLCLKVLGKRADGYHEIESIMLPISLYDQIALEESPAGIGFWCNHPQLQALKQNLAVAAAQKMLALAPPSTGVKIGLYKRIPVAAGLGGGSSDAAAVLKGLNRLWGLNLAQGELLKLGEQLGADVPFFILGQPAIARGKGERLRPTPFSRIWLVVVNPGFGVTSAWAYAGLNWGLTKKKGYTTMPSSGFREFGPAQVGSAQIVNWLVNDLEAVVSEQYPVIREIKQHLLASGALGALMSGSGPSVFGVFASRQQAEGGYHKLQLKAMAGWSIFLTHTLNQFH